MLPRLTPQKKYIIVGDSYYEETIKEKLVCGDYGCSVEIDVTDSAWDGILSYR